MIDKRQQMRTTEYFTHIVLLRRPYLKMEWIQYVLDHPLRTERQSTGLELNSMPITTLIFTKRREAEIVQNYRVNKEISV